MKIWFEKNGKHIVGKGGIKILESIEKEGSIAKAARKLGMSYRFVWNYINRLENVLGEKVIERERGGKSGGGSKLTETGKLLLKRYKKIEKSLGSRYIIVKGKVKKVERDKVEIVFSSKKLSSILNNGDYVEMCLFTQSGE